MSWRSALVVAGAVFTAAESSAQSTPTLEQLLDRMGEYLLQYETQLSSVVADEVFTQRVFYGRAGRSREHRVLESEVGFLRLPGGAEWLGFRDVRKLDGKPVDGNHGSAVADALRSPGGGMTEAKAIAAASASHNLGLPRTVNVPTAALEIIHPRHREKLQFEVDREERVRGTHTIVLQFVEIGRPTVVREPGGRDLVSSGKVWIDPRNGVVWRVDWTYQAENRGRSAPAPPRLRVDFSFHKPLEMMVPASMTEVFHADSANGEGSATYKNFRRFGTSARIVPQQR